MLKPTPPTSTITISIVSLFWLLLFGFASCLTLENNGNTDYTALMAIKSKFILDPDNILSTNWTTNTHYCTWFGVSCFNHRVTNIVLSGLTLQGQMSPAFANLTHLEELDLRRNELGGNIPNVFGSLRLLRILRLANNSLMGSIPANLSMCWKLERLNLANNFIEGSMPEELGYLANLQFLDISGNNLTGNIPASFGNFSSLECFYLEENHLDGTIPAELGKLSRVYDLRISGNNLIGNIPDSFGNFSSLEYFYLEENHLDGTIPAELGKLARLFYLDLADNFIEGSIPVQLGHLANLQFLYISGNNLTEYGLDGHASTKGDVYSFGILMLETFTRKRPTDDMFKEGLSLHQWVYQVFPDALAEVLDSDLVADIISSGEGSSAPINRNKQSIEDILVSIIQVALLCLKELPEERIDMKTAAARLKKIRAELKKETPELCKEINLAF